MPCTAPGVRTFIADEDRQPAQAEREQHREQAAGDRAAAGRRRSGSPSGSRSPRVETVTITYRTTSPRTAPTSGADRGIGQRPEPVEDALGDVGVEVDADRDGAGRDGLRQDAGQQELQVVVGRAGDRAAEDVDEDDQEQRRLQRDVDERLGGTPGLDQAALGQRQRVPDQRGTAGGSPRPSSSVGSSSAAVPVRVLMRRPPCGVVVSSSAAVRPGEGEEHLVEAGQVQGEFGDGDAGGGQPGDASRSAPRRR